MPRFSICLFTLLLSSTHFLTAQPAGGRDSLLSEAEQLMAVDSNEAARPLLLEVIGPVDSLSGVAYHKLGVLDYYAGDVPGAVDHFRAAVEVRDSIFTDAHNERAHSRSNLAYMYRLEDKLDSTAIVIREANDIYARLPDVDSLNWLRSLNELGALALTLENYSMGYSSSYRAMALSEEVGALDPYDAFLTYYRAARILLRLGKQAEALPVARRAVDLAPAAGNDPALVADAYNLLALVQRDLEDHEASYGSLQRALALPLREDDHGLTLAFLHANLATHYGQRSELTRFEHHHDRARRLFLANDAAREYYQLDRLPAIYLTSKDYTAALEGLDEAIAFLSDRPLEPLPLIHLYRLRATARVALDRKEAALDDYATLFALQDSLRQRVSDYASRSYYSRNLRPAFDRAILLYHEAFVETSDSNLLWKAFRLSERARAYSLLASLHAGGGRNGREKELLDRIAELERRRSLEQGNDSDELWDTRLALERLYESQRTEIQRPPPTLDSAALINQLRKENGLLLSYHLTEAAGLTFVLHPSGKLEAFAIEDRAQLSDRVSRFRQSILDGRYRRKSLRSAEEQRALDQDFLSAGGRLAEQLLPSPVRQKLQAKQAVRLYIVPDGSLHYLPFAALPLSTSAAPVDYRKVNYLQRRAVLSYAYSGAYLTEVARGQRRDSFDLPLLAFAPSFGGEKEIADSRRSSREVLRSGASLQPLRYNEPEVRGIGRLVPAARTYTGEAATKERFLELGGGARVLHLSSHGMVDSEDPNLSFIAFSQRDGLDPKQLLYFNDLYRLSLDNELTVLSACETNLGKLAAGETTMTMASAFAAAGARSTLTTLWQVDDEATKDLMLAFYDGLVDGRSRVASLRDAQSAALSADYAHPYYWAGLSLHGMAGPLPMGGSGDGLLPWWAWLVAAGVFGLMMLYLLRFLHAQKPADL